MIAAFREGESVDYLPVFAERACQARSWPLDKERRLNGSEKGLPRIPVGPTFRPIGDTLPDPFNDFEQDERRRQ